MTATTATTGSDHAAGSPAPALNRHQAFIASRLPAPLTQPGSACLKPLLDINPTTPAWYSRADASLRSALENSQLARCTSQHQLESLLGRITPLETFAAPLLKTAIQQETGLDLDVRNTYFVRRLHVRRPSSLGGLFDFSAGDPKRRTWYWDVSLLEAALHNFTAGEAAQPPNEGDEFITHDHSTANVRIGAYDKDRTLPLAPERFATLCRTLDLGQRYQTHLTAVLNPEEAAQKALVRQTWTTHLHNQLAEAVHLARMQAHIPDDAYQMLRQWLAGRTDIRLGDHAVNPGCLRMLGVDLSDILFLRPESGPSPRRCVVYIPGDDQHPVRHYDSSADFMVALRTRLHQARYRRFFAQFVPVREQAAFFIALKKRLDPTDRHALWDDYTVDPARHVGLDLVEQSLRVGTRPSLQTALKDQCELKIGRLLGDARTLAVPTDDEDREARIARFLGFVDAAMDLLNLLVFVPGLGQVMLLAMGTRLLHEVYSGIEAWEAGDTRQAWAHLLGVAVNLALIGTAGVVLPHVDTSAFVDGLIPVSVREGVSRLWKPDLAPYRHQPNLPARSQANELGLHEAADGAYLQLESHYHRLDAIGPGYYRARHSQAAELLNPYAPEFRSNGAGAWQHELEQPLGWSDERLFQRLGADAASLDAATARRLQHISGVDSDVLRATHQNVERPPALLSDSVTRFALDRDLGRLVQRLQNGGVSSGSLDELHMELQLLTTDPVWPRTKVLRLFNAAGRTIQEYPASVDAQVPRIDVRWPDLDADGLLQQVLGKLDEGEIRSLLREEFGQATTSLPARVASLRRRLAGDAVKRRADLFESHYRYRTAGSRGEPGTGVLKQHFPGLPDPIAAELARGADALERQRLISGRLPARLGREARHYLRNVRLARQHELLYLDSASQAEAYRIVLSMLRKLPGWSSQVRLEIRDRFFGGPLLDSLGPDTAPIRKVLVRDGEQYLAHDADGEELHGPDDLYASVLHALPDTERAALGFAHVGQGAQLKQALRALPPLPREDLARLLALASLKPGFRPPMRLADGRVGYALSGRGEGLSRRDGLARQLYPNLSVEQVEALHDLGTLRPTEALARLEALQAEYRALETTLQAWQREPQSYIQAFNRGRAMAGILRCWRHEMEPGAIGLLKLKGNLGRLPVLPASFDQVTALHLEHLELEDWSTLTDFLGHFAKLERIDASSHLLAHLAPAFRQLPGIRYLRLLDNYATALGPDSQGYYRFKAGSDTLYAFKHEDGSWAPVTPPPGRFDATGQLVSPRQLPSWTDGEIWQHYRLQGTAADAFRNQAALTGKSPAWEYPGSRERARTRLLRDLKWAFPEKTTPERAELLKGYNLLPSQWPLLKKALQDTGRIPDWAERHKMQMQDAGNLQRFDLLQAEVVPQIRHLRNFELAKLELDRDFPDYYTRDFLDAFLLKIGYQRNIRNCLYRTDIPAMFRSDDRTPFELARDNTMLARETPGEERATTEEALSASFSLDDAKSYGLGGGPGEGQLRYNSQFDRYPGGRDSDSDMQTEGDADSQVESGSDADSDEPWNRERGYSPRRLRQSVAFLYMIDTRGIEVVPGQENEFFNSAGPQGLFPNDDIEGEISVPTLGLSADRVWLVNSSQTRAANVHAINEAAGEQAAGIEHDTWDGVENQTVYDDLIDQVAVSGGQVVTAPPNSSIFSDDVVWPHPQPSA
ncbi:dermonecrotic toxin domain-containing protein [Pseudomonas sp. COR18]|uniref:dermonecrotic toxin domain-containing protein n=1 Tax=Pseudomonas sp. COR18 TaxID=3399680 RepID=UPI003B00BA36